MSVRYSYLALDEDQQAVVDWFAALPDEVTVGHQNDRLVIYFRASADRPLPPVDEVDPEKTPLVFIEKPRKRFAKLFTDGEVHFSPRPLKSQFPLLQKINLSFAKWLRQFDLVLSRKNRPSFEWNYYLEGGIQTFDQEPYALPKAMAALRAGQYFVHYRDNATVLGTLAKKLALRGHHLETD